MAHTIKKNSGFTIIELLIAMGVFVVLLAIVINIFISSIATQRSLVALMAINDNVSLGIEQMAREVRTGENTSFSIIDSPSPVEGGILAFENASKQMVSYRNNNGIFERGVCTGGTCTTAGNFIYVPITGDQAEIVDLRFYLSHFLLPPPSTDWPARITITLSVGSASDELKDLPTQIVTNIQTTISVRNL